MEQESDRYVVLPLLVGLNLAVFKVEDRECFLAKRYGVETRVDVRGENNTALQKICYSCVRNLKSGCSPGGLSGRVELVSLGKNN